MKTEIFDSGVISTEKQTKRNIRRQETNFNVKIDIISNLHPNVVRDPQIASKMLLDLDYSSILLVEPYRIKYIPLGLFKIYSYYKNLSPFSRIDFVIGKHHFGYDQYKTIFITAGEFSYYHEQLVRVTQYYMREYPDAEIVIGGVYVQGRNWDIANEFAKMGCLVFACEVPILDVPVDYSLDKSNMYNFVFTTRGCTLSCEFCYVKVIEPNEGIVPTWRAQIQYPKLPYIMIHDNNVLAFGTEHFTNLCDVLLEEDKPVIFDNGYDCRFWNKEFNTQTERLANAGLLSNTSLRSAFDTTSNQDKRVQDMLLDLGKLVPAEQILVYVLVNFDQKIDDCFYRAREVARCGAWPFIQYYAPSGYRGDPDTYKGSNYTPDFHIMQQYYNSKAFRKMDYENFKLKEEKAIMEMIGKKGLEQ